MTARPALHELLPPHVACWETAGDAPDGSLHPEEAAGIRTARPLRRAEFVTGRHCAHRALERLGAPAGPVPRGVRGAPGWPAGIVGSITHCAGYRAAAVARSGRVRAVGIDAEPDLPLPRGVLPAVALPDEAAGIADLAARYPGTSWDRLLFSAKESVYKVWQPVTGTSLGFEDAEVTFDPSGGFLARVLPHGGPDGGSDGGADGGLPRELAGRWRARDGLLLTAIAVPVP